MRAGIGMVLMLLAASLQADIYRSEARFGNTSFSDRPSSGAEPVQLNAAPYRYQFSVRHVIDGDTLVLKNGEKVRLIGINTPEVESRYTRAEAGGDAAREWLRQKLRSAQVWLEYDVEQRDKYDRQLAHVFLEDGEHLNLSLLEQGLAMLTLIPPNLRYSQQLIAAQKLAERAGRGIWQKPGYQPKPLSQLIPGESYSGWQRWQVTPRRIAESRKYINLIVSEHFEIKIAKSLQDSFPPLTQYLGQPLEVRGWLRRQGQQHFMIVQHPSAIQQR
ncbi:MAG: thermonuclease family protein [Methylophaga sp.]|nr:thermonuclease family protein [Methylophaga sp.]